ncbi:winged helix-turn-helix domain-containing protein [Pseudoalteromonas sp. BDTF-M6]|uniref:winged helix-turn-helix domain-containing protein n=1 Tax=Pseudoalteromonas sp. BDTF-M6 TaxID=2796132 RepID=UPI001BAFAB0C|nr:winged helix-turn-helix domain-containing protein [Pseudoalteromonas sp. BDTF-M6]MBS3796868.1 PD40 domain-containing protein [Pseudoalteromonas sp. BDTF-M6]
MKLTSTYAHCDFLIAGVRFKVSQSLLEHNGTEVKLTAKAAELLLLFLTSPDNVVDFDSAVTHVWDDNAEVGRKGFTNAVWMLRKGFKDVGYEDDVLESIPKVGYRLVAKITTLEKESEPSVKKPLTKRLRLMAMGGVIVLVLSFAASYLLLKSDSWHQSAGVSYNKTTNFEGVEELPSVSHNGQYLAFTWIRENEFSQIYIKNLLNGDAPLKQVSGSRFKEVSATWSPNDNHIAYARVAADGKCEVITKDLLLNNEVKVASGCYYIPYRRLIDWSISAPNHLVYAKQLDDRVALFKVDLKSNAEIQLTFPNAGEIDFAPRSFDDKVYFVRDTQSKYITELNVLDGEGKVARIGKEMLGIVDFDLAEDIQMLFVNTMVDSDHRLVSLTMDGELVRTISKGRLSSNINYSQQRNSVFVVEHNSNEYIANIDLASGQVRAKVVSSSRDLYGEYMPIKQAYVFLSTRDKSWGVWQKTATESINLTAGLGEAALPRVHQPTGKILVRVKPHTGASRLFVLQDGEKHVLDLDGIEPNFYSWSDDGETVYFSASEKQKLGIFAYHMESGQIERLTQTGEVYALELDDTRLVVTKQSANGLWIFDKQTKQFTLLSEQLDKADFGAFYIQDGDVYFVKRTKLADQIMKITSTDIQLVREFPANSIRRFFGIAKGESGSAILTMKLANEADIYRYTLSK